MTFSGSLYGYLLRTFYQSEIHGLVTPGSPGSVLEMQSPRPYSRLNESESAFLQD